MKQLIEEQRKDFDIWFKEYPGVPTIGEIQEWYEDRFKQFIDGLITNEQEYVDIINKNDNGTKFEEGYKDAKENSISHLKEIKENLTNQPLI